MLLASYCDSVVQSFEAMQNNVMGIVGGDDDLPVEFFSEILQV